MELQYETYHLVPGTFWQELFVGRHLSVDFWYGTQIRCTEGFSTSTTRFSRWILVDDCVHVPQFLLDIIKLYEYSNIETIGGNIIEVHLRGNPDFDDGAVEIIPVWNDESPVVDDRFVYVSAEDGDRLGFYKRY